MKKVLMICFMLILSVTLVGCSNKANKYKISYEGKGTFGFDEEKMTYCLSKYISTKQELETISKKLNNGYFDESSANYNSEIGLIIRNYDDSFFIDKSLIVCVIDGENRFDYSVDKLKVSNDELVINIKKTYKMGTFTDEAFANLSIIEVEKNEFQNIKSVKTTIK